MTELPKPYMGIYTERQMIEYGKKCGEEMREQCAKVCESADDFWHEFAHEAAAAIRSLPLGE